MAATPRMQRVGNLFATAVSRQCHISLRENGFLDDHWRRHCAGCLGATAGEQPPFRHWRNPAGCARTARRPCRCAGAAGCGGSTTAICASAANRSHARTLTLTCSINCPAFFRQIASCIFDKLPVTIFHSGLAQPSLPHSEKHAAEPKKRPNRSRLRIWKRSCAGSRSGPVTAARSACFVRRPKATPGRPCSADH